MTEQDEIAGSMAVPLNLTFAAARGMVLCDPIMRDESQQIIDNMAEALVRKSRRDPLRVAIDRNINEAVSWVEIECWWSILDAAA